MHCLNHPRTFPCEGAKLCMQKGFLMGPFTTVCTHTLAHSHAHTYTQSDLTSRFRPRDTLTHSRN